MISYGHSSVGRAQVSKTWCREFESLCPCQICLFTPEMVFFILSLFFCFILVYSGYVMDNVIVFFVNILVAFFTVITYIFAVLLFAFMLGGFLIAILGYFRVKRLENPEILQNKIKSHRRVLNIFTGIFLTIIVGVFVIILTSKEPFAGFLMLPACFIAMPFAYVIIYNLSFIIFAKLKGIRLKLQELEMLKRRQ